MCESVGICMSGYMCEYVYVCVSVHVLCVHVCVCKQSNLIIVTTFICLKDHDEAKMWEILFFVFGVKNLNIYSVIRM